MMMSSRQGVTTKEDGVQWAYILTMDEDLEAVSGLEAELDLVTVEERGTL